MSISPLYHDEEIVGATCVARDVTERKKLESKLIQAQKMESIGTLAGGVAHDFNNLLMGIQGYTSLMLLDLDAIHPHYARLKSIEEQVRSGADLTKQLLGFARGGKYQVTTIDLNDVIEKSSVMFGRTKKEISIHCNLDSNLWPVEADRGQIEQALLNLYVNAWQAMPGGGKLYIDTQNIIIGDNYVSTFTIEPGNYIKISVTDTGLGMDDKTIERIFDPFFTTKEMGRGTGLGLASVYGIIKGHRGMIKVYSEKGHGTTFTIYLPSSTKNVMPEKELHSVEETLRGHETILLVDDEEVILDVSKAILENLGYRIISSDR
jgi:signal transduction histidine kinase